MSPPESTSDFRVVHYTDPRVVDPRGKHDLPYREFQRARNRIFDVCEKHGSAGPMGRFPIDDSLSDEQCEENWRGAVGDPAFFIVDDQVNDERYIYIDIEDPEVMNHLWISDIGSALNGMDGWGVCISNIRYGYLIILPFVMLVNGKVFESCNSVDEIIRECRRSLITKGVN